MSFSSQTERWQAAAVELQSQQANLTRRWETCLSELLAVGTPPEQSLLNDQAAYARQLSTLHEEIRAVCPRLHEIHPAALEPLTRELKTYVEQQQTRNVLEQILDLKHLSDPGFEPLDTLRNHARGWLAQLASNSQVDHNLTMAFDPAVNLQAVGDLLDWVQNVSTIDDHTWDRLQTSVTEHFGRGMATAISRGRIVSAAHYSEQTQNVVVEPEIPQHFHESPAVHVSAQTALDQIPTEHISTETEARVPPPVPVPESSVSHTGISEPRFVFDFANSGSKMTGVLDSALERRTPASPTSSTDSPRILDERPTAIPTSDPVKSSESGYDSGLLMAWSQWRELRGQSREHTPSHQTPAAALADAALATSGEERVRCMFRLVDQLVIDDQLDLAYQVMRLLEGTPALRLTPLPASLLSVCQLSRYACYPQGELNRHIEEELRKQQPKRYQDFSSADRLAYELICRASALLPALLCSSTSAVRLLQTFSIEQNLIQLYNYCSRIASYAERLQGKAGELLQAGNARVGSTKELEALRQSAQDWLIQGIKQTASYTRSSQLYQRTHWTVTPTVLQASPEAGHIWSQWQETWLQTHRLLLPVIRNSSAECAWVKQEIDRLTHVIKSSLTKPSVNQSARMLDAQSAMRDVLSRGLEFATGWLRLGGGFTSSSTNLPVKEIEELRGEIRERTPAVLAELRQYSGIQQSPTVRAGAFCLMRVVQWIHGLFEAKATWAWREPESRQLLNAELLKIPGLPLNDQWESEVDADELESDLLEHISRGAKSWREAFELQNRAGDHVATGRLLELPVWSSITEQNQLAEQRQTRIHECRRELMTDLENLISEFESLSQAHELSADDQPKIQRKIDRLQTLITKTLNFPIVEIQLQQLRLMLQRRSLLLGKKENISLTTPNLPPANSEQESRTPLEVPSAPTLESTPDSSEAGNGWVMDLLWEDR